MSEQDSSKPSAASGSFARRIAGVLSLVLAVMLVGSVLGIWSLSRVSEETAKMVEEAMAAERVAGDLQRQLSVNVARSKALALSSEPQVGDVLTPEINQTTQAVDELLRKLGAMLAAPPDKAVFGRVTEANQAFVKARQELTVARDSGVMAKIEEISTKRFNPAAQALMEAVTQLADSQRAKIDASALRISGVSQSARSGLVLFGLCALALGGVLSVWLVRGVTRPIRQAVDTANRVALLDLSEHIEGHDRDEGGQLLGALAQMQRSLRELAASVQAASRSVAEGAGEIASGNMDFSARTEQAAGSLQDTASAVEQISANMQQSLAAASRGEALARSAASDAVAGGKAMSEVMQTMDDISQASGQIVDITGVIDSIAFQTNILALNAAVEAARAGEQGRGFAVVAAEVRILANRATSAARQIKTLIGASMDKVELGTSRAGQTRDAMNALIASVQSVALVIAEVTAATREQSSAMASINASVNRLDTMTQQNAAVIEESAAAARQLQERADELRETAGRFRLPGVSRA